MDFITAVSEEIYEMIMAGMGRAISAGKLPNEPAPAFSVEIPADTSHGDFAVNAAMVSAKAFRLPPRKIAEILCEELIFDGTKIERCEIAGPGFINLFVRDEWFCEIIQNVISQGEDYGRSNFGMGKKVMIEFVSANPTGPMHIGNARGGAIGDSLAEVMAWSGYDVTREFYVNDAGNQIIKLGASLEARYMQIFDGGFPFPEDGYHGDDIIELAGEFAEIHGDSYINSSEIDRRSALASYALPKNIKKLEEDLLKYRIKYDVWFRESALHDNGEVERVIDILSSSGYTYESDGALWFKATEFGEAKDYVLVRSNRIPTYVVPDIAYHYNKFVTREFDIVINVLGADHHGYVPCLKHAVEALGVEGKKLDFVLMQMVRLIKDGEPIKASKRTGKSITLSTLLDEVPLDAARFFFNLREANTHLDFDLTLAVEQSSKNPVYYVQYANARICKILDRAECDYRSLTVQDLLILHSPEEREVIRKIALFPREISDARKSYDPSILTRYCIELASVFHKFYDKHRVICDDHAAMKARLALCWALQTTLKNALSILKIETPDSM